jgi:P27 family predicted phage terminase small subunit
MLSNGGRRRLSDALTRKPKGELKTVGERGPKPLPANVHKLRGNASHKPLASLLDDIVRPDVEIPECPQHLDEEAMAEWARITPHLERLGLISQLDRAALVGYCQAWSDYVWAARRIADLNQGDASGERGRIWDTPSGYKQISVPMQIKNRALDQMDKFLAHFGLSPALRSRVTASDPRAPVQPDLPGVDPKPAEGGWGTFQ